MIKPHQRHLRDSGSARLPPSRALTIARSGITAVDLIVVLVLISLSVLLVLMVLPRNREHARMASCQRNLAHVGFALAHYDQIEHRLPSVSGLGRPDSPRDGQPKSPLLILLEGLVQPNLLGITDAKTPPPPRPGEVPGELPVLGFTCASDRNATSGLFPAPNSYRACTGDTPAGENGAFSVGRVFNLREIQDRDGLSFTAAFSERLLGDNLPGSPVIHNYAIVPGPLPALGCPAQSHAVEWRGDAGSSWIRSDYRSTLYNHALTPGGQPSCILDSGRAAFMGASSGHVVGVNLLLFDGRVTVVKPSIDPKIWKEFAKIGERMPSDER